MNTVENGTKSEFAVQLPGGEIRGRLVGNGPILCLLSTLAGTWVGQVKALADRFRVLTYDMRGFGTSPSEAGFPSNEEHASDLALVFDALGIERAHVVGLSHGGAVAQLFALQHPKRIDSLMLVSTFARASGSTRLFLDMLYGFLDRHQLDEFWDVLKSFLCSEGNWRRVMRHEKYLRRQMFDHYTAESLRAIYGDALKHDTTERLRDVRNRTLVVGGEEDMLFPVRITRQLSELIPNAECRLLPAAHVPPVEVAQLFNELVADFCIGHSPSGQSP